VISRKDINKNIKERKVGVAGFELLCFINPP